MSYDTPVAPTLFDLLARGWSLSGPVTALCFNAEASSIAFAGGGALGIAPIADPERPETRIRVAADTGRATILPRQSPVRPLARADRTQGPLASFGAKSFVTGGAKDPLVSVTPRGQVVPVSAGLSGAVTALARDPASSTIAAAGGSRVTLVSDSESSGFDSPAPVTALAFAPGGGTLAVGHEGGLFLWKQGNRLCDVGLAQAPRVISWSLDGAFLACGFDAPGFALIRAEEGGIDLVPDYPTEVRSFGWSSSAQVLVTSGAFRTVAWEMSSLGRGEPVEVGRAGLVIVDRVAVCPTRPLVAVAYASGLICLAKIGARDEMVLRTDGAPVTALDWSPDGAHLGFGCADGTAALMSFPPNMFK